MAPDAGNICLYQQLLTYFLISFKSLYYKQDKYRSDNNSETDIVLGLIFYSDSTSLSGKGNKAGWPLLMSLVNIPLCHRKEIGGYKLVRLFPTSVKDLDSKSKIMVFNQCLQHVMGSFKETSREGFIYKGVKCFPNLFAYVHDYPEGCKVNNYF